jgi:hypothetical protein
LRRRTNTERTFQKPLPRGVGSAMQYADSAYCMIYSTNPSEHTTVGDCWENSGGVWIPVL